FSDSQLSARRPLRTTLDPEVQRVCERSIENRLSRLSGNNVAQAAAVVLDNATGELLAMAGSRDYSAPPDGQVNGAASRRSPGSALKPFTFLLALQRDA